MLSEWTLPIVKPYVAADDVRTIRRWCVRRRRCFACIIPILDPREIDGIIGGTIYVLPSLILESPAFARLLSRAHTYGINVIVDHE